MGSTRRKCIVGACCETAIFAFGYWINLMFPSAPHWVWPIVAIVALGTAVVVWIWPAWGNKKIPPEGDDIARARLFLKKLAEWIVKVEPKDHSDREESLRFSFNLEKVYGFLEDAFVPRYHKEARDYAKKHGGRAEALSYYLNQLSSRITAEELDPSFSSQPAPI